MDASGSMKIANKNGESGHPCLVPRWSVKLCDVIPFVVTVALGEVYSVLIQWTNYSPKPKLCNVCNKKNPVYLIECFFCV